MTRPGVAPTVVDLFCGCGGMSWGLKKAGFQILAGVDNSAEALATFRANFPGALALELDLTADGVDELRKRVRLRKGELDVLVGGPPCQGFSKNVPRAGRFLEDPRNLLVRSFFSAVETLLPKTVVMENVAEMANAFDGQVRDELLGQLESLGYATTHDIHNAAEFGVPQRRRRVVFIASRTELPMTLPEPTHALEATRRGEAPAISVWEAIGDLGLVRGSRARPNTYASAPFSEFQKLMRADATALTDHEERPLRPRQQARYDALKPGEGLKELPPELRTKGGYSGAYGRLTKEMVAPTITRWVFHPGSGRFGHPVEHRILTIREAARLQSFSDDFVFVGANQTKSWQIGNAVPPLLMRAVAPSLRAALGRDATAPAREGTPRQLTLLRAGGDR